MNLLKMKTSLRSGWSTLLLSLVLGTGAAQAANVSITSFDGQRATIVGQGFTKASQQTYQVNFYVNGDFKSDVNTNSNGSFSHTVAASAGNQIEVKVLNYNGSGNHASYRLTVQGYSSQPSQPSQPTQPPAFRMESSKLREYAEIQARTVANRVANTYGELEKWKYNFSIGYWQGIDAFNGSYTARSVTDDARQEGRNRGTTPGYNAGYAYAASQAGSLGAAAAVARFRAVVNTESAPNMTAPSVTTPSFDGLQSSANSCDTEDSTISSLEGRLESEMRILRFGDSDYGYLDYDATAYSIRFRDLQRWGRTSYQFVDSWFRADYAWSEWINNDLGGKYNKTNYRKLESDQQSEFRRVFSAVYDQVIDEKYYRKKTEYNANARNRGQWYGVEIGNRQAYDRGCNLGYAESYSTASVSGYRAGFAPTYIAKFNSTAQYYNSNPVISFDGIRLIDGNRNGVFELGENVGIAVGSVTNLGRVAAQNLRVRMTGEGIDELANSESVSVEPSTSKPSNQIVENLARVRSDVIADKNNTVAVAIGANQHSLSYVVSWKLTIRALATADAASAISLKQFVLQNIQNEYTRAESAKNNIYKEKDKTASKLRDLVELYETLPENQRSVILSMGPTIVAMKEQAEHNKWSTGGLRKDFEAMALRIK